MERNKKAGAWLAIGIGTGTALGVALDNLALGIGLGAAIGFIVFYLGSKRPES